MQNRIIKFRAWTGSMMEPWNHIKTWESLGHHLETCSEFIFMQFTGLIDKSGKQIYELDILRDHSGYEWIVVWLDEQACFGVKSIQNNIMSEIIDNKNMDVIGNIYDTPRTT